MYLGRKGEEERKYKLNMNSAIVIPIPAVEVADAPKEKKKFHLPNFPVIAFVKEKTKELDTKKLIHSVKVGTALVLVSLLYFLDAVYKEVDDNNAMWAIMTVVVIFEFYAGATLSKGINRGIGTVIGGGLGCLAAVLGQEIGGLGNSIIIGVSVFVCGGAATYTRLIPSFKIRYDYGAMIFILTFNLVAVSGLRAEKVMELARERLLMILLGFGICIFTSLFVFPIWASDELHSSAVSKFEDLASSIEGCLREYFGLVNDKEDQSIQPIASFAKCKSVLNSKSRDESLGNFARWEPWHGKFGLSYPWEKYVKIGEVLRGLAATILSLQGCLQSTRQPLQNLKQSIKEPCVEVGSSLAWTLRELGESIMKMRRCHAEAFIAPKLKLVRKELSQVMTATTRRQLENTDGLAMASFVFLLMEMAEKLEELVKEVEELGELAGFSQT